jgi:hypothetical protein
MLGALALVLATGAPAVAGVTSIAGWNAPSSSVWVDNAGGIVIVSGQTVQKRTASGSVVWTTTLSNGINFSHRLVFDSANNMYLDGYEDERTEPASVTVARISSGGTINWNFRYAVGAINQSEHMSEGPMVIAPNGSLYVLGREGQASAPPYNVTLLRINPSTGALITSRALPPTLDSMGGGMSASALVADTNSNIYYGHPGGLVSYSPSLATERWVTGQYTVPVRAITLDRWNNVYVTGPDLSGPPFYCMYVARVNSANGSTLWSHHLETADTVGPYPPDPTDFGVVSDERAFGGNAIAIDGKGYVWAAGRGADTSGWDGGWVGRFEPAGGTLVWSHHYGFNLARGAVVAMALDAYDSVYVTGKQAENDHVTQVPSLVEVLGPTGLTEVSSGLGTSNLYQENYQITTDKKGNVYWANFSDTFTRTIFNAQLRGRFPTGIATSPGTGKTKVLMDTFNHQNILLQTFSATDVLQPGTTNWNYGTYGRRDVDLSAGPDGSVRILQQLDFNGTTSAAVSVLVRNDAGTLTSSSARNVTNLRALKIATGSDNKSYILLRSTLNGSCQVWRMSATGTFETSATFGAQTNKAPAGIAVDGTSIVYLIWQGLDGQLFPWRLNTSLAIVNQSASLAPTFFNFTGVLAGAGVGADHRLRLLVDFVGMSEVLYKLTSTGTFDGSGSQNQGGWLGYGLSVGGDNRSHLLNADGVLSQYQHGLADANLNPSGVQTLNIPAN